MNTFFHWKKNNSSMLLMILATKKSIDKRWRRKSISYQSFVKKQNIKKWFDELFQGFRVAQKKIYFQTRDMWCVDIFKLDQFEFEKFNKKKPRILNDEKNVGGRRIVRIDRLIDWLNNIWNRFRFSYFSKEIFSQFTQSRDCCCFIQSHRY